MTLDLSPEQPPEAPDVTAAAPAHDLLVTIVTTDGVVVRVTQRPDGMLVFTPSGNRTALVLDRFQKRALTEALMEA